MPCSVGWFSAAPCTMHRRPFTDCEVHSANNVAFKNCHFSMKMNQIPRSHCSLFSSQSDSQSGNTDPMKWMENANQKMCKWILNKLYFIIIILYIPHSSRLLLVPHQISYDSRKNTKIKEKEEDWRLKPLYWCCWIGFFVLFITLSMQTFRIRTVWNGIPVNPFICKPLTISLWTPNRAVRKKTFQKISSFTYRFLFFHLFERSQFAIM